MQRKTNPTPIEFKFYLRKGTVLDVGGGSGNTIKQVCGPEATYICFDNDQDIIGSHKRVILGDVLGPWLVEYGLYDVVVFSHILEHFSHDQINHVLGQARRVLREGGKIIILCPSTRNKGFYSEYTHVRPHNEYSLRGMLEANGFEVLESGGFRYWHPYQSQVWAVGEKRI